MSPRALKIKVATKPVPSGGSRAESISCLFQLLKVPAFVGLWLHHSNLLLPWMPHLFLTLALLTPSYDDTCDYVGPFG